MSDIYREIQSDSLFDMEIVCVLDGYEPQLASFVIEVIGEQSEETLRVMLVLACDEAYRRVNLN